MRMVRLRETGFLTVQCMYIYVYDIYINVGYIYTRTFEKDRLGVRARAPASRAGSGPYNGLIGAAHSQDSQPHKALANTHTHRPWRTPAAVTSRHTHIHSHCLHAPPQHMRCNHNARRSTLQSASAECSLLCLLLFVAMPGTISANLFPEMSQRQLFLAQCLPVGASFLERGRVEGAHLDS
jgi:hypothetical protein